MKTELIEVTIDADGTGCAYTCHNLAHKCARCGEHADFTDDLGHFYGNSRTWNGPNDLDVWDGLMLCESCWKFTGSSTGER